MPERLLRFSWWKENANSLVAVGGVLLILIGTFAGILKVYSTADKTHKAICALRQERVDGVLAGREFLRRHPTGIPGITPADILRSIHQQQETVRAFRFADCP